MSVEALELLIGFDWVSMRFGVHAPLPSPRPFPFFPLCGIPAREREKSIKKGGGRFLGLHPRKEIKAPAQVLIIRETRLP